MHDFERLAARVPEVVFRLDRQLRLLYGNARLEGLTAAPGATLEGRTLRELGVWPAGMDVLERACLRAFTEGEDVHVLFTEGDRIVRVGLAPEFEGGADAVGLLGIAEDVTRAGTAADHEAWFRAIVESIPHMVWVGDPDGGNVYNNRQLEEFVGMRSEELKGQGWTRAVHPDDVATVSQEWASATAARRGFSGMVRVRGADGSFRWFKARASPVRSETGEIVRWVGTWTDLDDRVRAENAVRESERVYRAIEESIDYGIWICAPDGRNTYASESFLRMVGMTQQQCSDFGWGEVLHPDDRDRTVTAWQECVRTGEAWDIEHRFRGADGRWHPVLARGVPIRNDAGEVACWAGINLDISRLKAAEVALVEADRLKDQFLAFLTTAMRSLLRSVSRARRSLARPGRTRDEVRSRMAVIEARTGQLERLLDDLISLTRRPAGPVVDDRPSTELASALWAAADRWRGAFLELGVPLALDPPEDGIEVPGSASRDAAAVDHLFRIASRVAPRGSSIHANARRGRADGLITLTIAGIPDLPRARARHLHRASQKRKATGSPSPHPLALDVALLDGVVGLRRGSAVARTSTDGTALELVLRLPLVTSDAPAP
jgi:PAS domain S-box-containing protein